MVRLIKNVLMSLSMGAQEMFAHKPKTESKAKKAEYLLVHNTCSAETQREHL